MIDVTLLKATDAKNKYGKTPAVVVKEVDSKINELIVDEQIDMEVVKREVYILTEKYKTRKDALACLEYLYMKLEDAGQFVSENVDKIDYKMVDSYAVFKEAIKQISSALEHQNLVIPSSSRAMILGGHQFLRDAWNKIQSERELREKGTEDNQKDGKYSIKTTIRDFKVSQSLLNLNYPGGVKTAAQVMVFAHILVPVAFEIQNDAKIIQLFSLGTDDVSAVMAEIVKANEEKNQPKKLEASTEEPVESVAAESIEATNEA